MDLSGLFAFLVLNLGIGAAGGIVIFALAVAADIVCGGLLARKLKTFDPHKLGSFLESQVGAQRTLIVLGSVATACLAALGSAQLAHTPLQVTLQILQDTALAAAIAGSAANFAAVASDIKAKLTALRS